MSDSKLVWKIGLIDLSLSLIFIVLLAIFAGLLLSKATAVRNDLANFEAVAGAQLDVTNYGQLKDFDDGLSNVSLADSVNAFVGAFVIVLLIFCLIVAFVKAAEFRMLGKVNYWHLTGWYLLVNFGGVVLGFIYLSLITAFLAFLGLADAIWLILILGAVILSFYFMGFYTWIYVKLQKKKYDCMRMLGQHTVRMLIGFAYIILFWFLTGLSVFATDLIMLVPFSVLILFLMYFWHVMVAAEQIKLVSKPSKHK